MKRLFVLVLAILAGVLVFPIHGPAHASAATARPFPLTVVDDQGNRVHLTHRPTRIITLYAAYTEIVFALGLEKRTVGDGSQYAEGAIGITNAAGKPRAFRYPSEWPSKLGRDYPVRALQLTHVEGGFSQTPFNLETITSLHPDLILAPYYKSQISTFQKMKELGFAVVFLNPSNVQGIMRDITLVGKVTGATTQATRVVNAMKTQLSAVKARVARVHTHPRVFYELDATNPTQPITAGPRTVIDEAIGLVRGKNIADSVTTCSGTECYPAFNLEALVLANPQIIVLSDAAYGMKPEDVRARPGWGTMAAVKSNTIYGFNPDLLSKFGPRVVIGIRDLARLVHPEVY